MKRFLSTSPYKGARDFFPEDIRIRNYIFEIWKKTAKKFGFEEYDVPFLETLELYQAKSGEELVNNQLYSFTDRGGRKVAIRPEKTPSVARMVAGKLRELPKPIKWFNIGNCYRYERPQKGRGREFFQFDCDIFGIESVDADLEVFSIPIEVMKELGANEKMFEIRVSNRRLTEFYLKSEVNLDGGISEVGTKMYKVGKVVDGKGKMTEQVFILELEKLELSKDQIQKLLDFINSDVNFVEKYRKESYGAEELTRFFELAEDLGYKKFFKFSPEIMRGLDYYSGNVVEQFDLNPGNSRAMWGGGRYDNLVSLFSDEKVPGVGFAMGDVTLLEFLKGWNLLPSFESETKVFVSLFSEVLRKETFELAKKLRESGINTFLSLEAKEISKQIKEADKRGIPFFLILGPEEFERKEITLKNLKSGEQKRYNLDELILYLSR